MNGASWAQVSFDQHILGKWCKLRFSRKRTVEWTPPVKGKANFSSFHRFFQGQQSGCVRCRECGISNCHYNQDQITPHAGAALGALCRCASAQMTTGGFTHHPGRGTSEPNGWKWGIFVHPCQETPYVIISFNVTKIFVGKQSPTRGI